MLQSIMKKIHTQAVLNGFWDEDHPAIKIALIHSEVSEVLEAIRHGNPPSKTIPEYDQVTEELADCIIRILDFAQYNEYDIEGAILAKMNYNETRPYKHGKAF